MALGLSEKNQIRVHARVGGDRFRRDRHRIKGPCRSRAEAFGVGERIGRLVRISAEHQGEAGSGGEEIPCAGSVDQACRSIDGHHRILPGPEGEGEGLERCEEGMREAHGAACRRVVRCCTAMARGGSQVDATAEAAESKERLLALRVALQLRVAAERAGVHEIRLEVE